MTMSPAESKKQQSFFIVYFKVLVVVLFLTLLVPGYLLLIKPERSVYQQNKALFAENERDLTQKNARLLEYKKVLMSYKNISPDDQEKIAEVLPYDPSEANLYVNFSSLAEAVGAQVEGISVQLGEGSAGQRSEEELIQEKSASAGQAINGQLKTALANFELSGISYTKTKELLNLIENNLRILDVKSFKFAPAEGNLSLVMQVYYLK